LTPGTLSPALLLQLAAGAGLLGVIVIIVQSLVADRIGHFWSTLSLCVALGGAGITVLCCNLRTAGVYGVGAAAAVGGLALFAPRLRAATPVALLTVCILCGLLAAGRFYPDPGVSWLGVGILLVCPLPALLGLAVPARHTWLRGLVALLAVSIVVAAIAVPTALAAKRAAETDPYAAH
jgi:hypothetical protein